VFHARERSATLERFRFIPPPGLGHAPSRSFGAVFRYPTGSGLVAAWPGDWSLPSSSGGAHGVHPFAVLIPHRVGGISADPGPRAVRALHPPRLIFVGVIDSPGWNFGWKTKGRGNLGLLAFDFWASLPSAVRARGCHSHGPRSCLGLCLLQGCGTRIRAFARDRPRCGSPASGSWDGDHRRHCLSAHGL